MSNHPPLLRSRTNNKMVDVKIGDYKPRDWDYQNIKHQLRPRFVLGRSKKRVANPAQKEFTAFKELPKTKTSTSIDFYKRELKPAVYRSYILSQILTLPGAVKIEESKVNDDQNKKDRIKVIRNKNLCFLSKLNNEFGSNVPFLPGSTDKEIKKGKIYKGKSCGDFRNIKVVKKEEKKGEKKEEKKVNEKVLSPQRNRIKRNIKIKK